MWLLLTLFFSLLPMFSVASKSVPELLHIGRVWLMGISLCTGCIQGLTGSMVIPYLAEKFPSQKHSFTTVANVLMSCLFPAMVVIMLDAKCLAGWARLWSPCMSAHARQFELVVACDGGWGPSCDIANSFPYHVKALSKSDVCNPHYVWTRASGSICLEVAMLRLQDIWLSKFITSGFVVPVMRIVMGLKGVGANEMIGKLAVFLAYAIMTSGHLPLFMLVLFLGMLGETVAIAISEVDNKIQTRIHNGERQDITNASITMTQVASSILHLASASGHALTLSMVGLILLHRALKALRSISDG